MICLLKRGGIGNGYIQNAQWATNTKWIGKLEKNGKLDGWMRGTWIVAGWGGVVLIAILTRG